MPGADNLIEIQLTPAGEFRPSDGRPMKVPSWRVDAAIAAKLIERFNVRKTPLVVDYEHQTLRAEDNGQPAPAAAWFKAITWHEGRGLFATVELTARAKQYIADLELRFVSPVFTYDSTGAITEILMAAFTNTPAIDGMEPLALRAAASYGLNLDEESPMNKTLLAALCALLGLAANPTDDQLIAAANAAKPKLAGFDDLIAKLGLAKDAKPEDALVALTARLDEPAKLRAALGVDAGATLDATVAACTAMKTQAAANAPDPAQFVSVAAFEAVKTELATLTAKQRDEEVASLVEQGLADGRLLPAQKEWATALGRKDVTELTAYLKTAQPIAALSGTQTRGQPPVVTANEHGLTADELAVCTATGIDPKDFAKTKAG